MDKEEYYKRIERINNRFRTDRVSADEEYQLVCQKNYLSTKYIEHLEQQVKKQKEVIDKAIEYISSNPNVYYGECLIDVETLKNNEMKDEIVGEIRFISNLLDILKEVSE